MTRFDARLQALHASSDLPDHVFQQAKDFLTALGTTLTQLGEPTITTVDGALVIEWIRARELWSVDFYKDAAMAMRYVPRDGYPAEVSLHESDDVSDFVKFFKRHLAQDAERDE